MTKLKLKSGLLVLARKIQKHYGKQVQGIYSVDLGQTYDPEDRSDAYVIVVLADGNWRYFDEVGTLAGLSYDVLEETEVFVDAEPVTLSAWNARSGKVSEISPSILERAESLLEVVVA